VTKFWRQVTILKSFALSDIETALEFAQQEFELSEKQSDGKSQREHLENVAKQIGRKPKELEDLIELPESMKECWHWFLRLNRKRPAGMGISEIPYSEIKSFFDLIGLKPELYELELIEAFDRIAMESFAKQQEKEQAQQEAKAKVKK